MINSDQDNISLFLKSGKTRKTVVVQGLGFVGSAMLTAVAAALGSEGNPLYNCIGVDRSSSAGLKKINCINSGRLPMLVTDGHFLRAFKKCFKFGNIMATADKYAYRVADIVIVDINLDVQKHKIGGAVNANVALKDFILAMRVIAANIDPDCLVIIESTVPPGFSEKIIAPLFSKEFKKRGFGGRVINLAHAYERVMPGKDYLKSITSFYRVFSGINRSSGIKARKFLESIIDTKNYPLTEFSSTTASEMAKVLENSFRATNIAFIQEWTEFAESAGVNLYDVIAAIRKRDTHKNIMLPGFGVGGYCLTKDPLLADWSSRHMFGRRSRMDFSVRGVAVNDAMPLHSFGLLKNNLKRLKNKNIVLLGVAYRSDVGDTRFSPSEKFFLACRRAGAKITPCDPFVGYWQEADSRVESDLSALNSHKFDAMVLAVNHGEYLDIKPAEFRRLLKPGGLILDCCNCISDSKAVLLRRFRLRLAGVGKGHWVNYSRGR